MRSNNKTRYALMGLLTFSPMSGYDIKKTFEKSLNYFWRESYGQIYPTLKKLTAEGMTESRREHLPGQRGKIVYALEPEGLANFKDWLRESAEPMRERNELLLKLFFGRHSGLDTNIRHLQEAREQYLSQLDEYEELQARLKTDYPGNPDQPYWLIALDYGLEITKAQISWCDSSLSKLKEAREHQLKVEPATIGV